VQLIQIDSDRFLQAAEDGILPGLFLLGWGADYPDVSNFLDTHFGDQATKMLGNPFKDILQPLRLGISTPDEIIRQNTYAAANTAIREHVPLIPLAHGGWVNPQTLAAAFNQGIVDAYADPFGFERFAEMEAPGRDELVWIQNYEPLSLYCADETDSDSLRACSQIAETLYRFKAGTLQTEPGLAEICEPNPEMTIWTCHLHQDVSFHDGTSLDAEDVVLSFAVQWDSAHPLHRGNLGEFFYFESFWGSFLNVPPP
jgi:peptide/nickel transport system substrate-binding protein